MSEKWFSAETDELFHNYALDTIVPIKNPTEETEHFFMFSESPQGMDETKVHLHDDSSDEGDVSGNDFDNFKYLREQKLLPPIVAEFYIGLQKFCIQHSLPGFVQRIGPTAEWARLIETKLAEFEKSMRPADFSKLQNLISAFKNLPSYDPRMAQRPILGINPGFIPDYKMKETEKALDVFRDKIWGTIKDKIFYKKNDL